MFCYNIEIKEARRAMARIRFNECIQNWLLNLFRNLCRIEVITAVVMKSPISWGYNDLEGVISWKVGLFS
jgi:hypothetical protein